MPNVTPATPRNTTLLLLCGGAGSRLGGVDKPLAIWRDRRLIEYIVAGFDPNLPTLVSANRNLDAYQVYGDVFTDGDAMAELTENSTTSAGPLVGIYGGLQRLRTQWLLVAPGDTPKLRAGWYEALFAASADHQAVVAHDGTRQQHLHVLLHKSVQPRLLDYLRSGGFAVHSYLAQLAPAVVQYDDAGQFKNFNTPADFAER